MQYADYCYQTIPNLQHVLYAYFGDIDDTSFLVMSGPKTAEVGSNVECMCLPLYVPLLTLILLFPSRLCPLRPRRHLRQRPFAGHYHWPEGLR